MRAFKKICSLLLVVFMLFSMVACNGEYNYATGNGNGGNGTSSAPVQPEMDNDPTNDFTVTLRADGKPYSPRMQMWARWSDLEGFGVYQAPIDENGVARIDGLNGDYRVTLSAVPNEYTYDPNTHIATNDAKNIFLDLYTINFLSGTGTGIYDCIQFSKIGVYSAVIQESGQAIYFQYAPDRSGTYTIESWADTTADNINPYIEVYNGSSQYKYWVRTVNDGGTMGSYTINFVHNVQIADENISAGGQAVYTFAIKADSKNNKYPITITFAVKRDGDFSLDGPDGSSGSTVISAFNFSSYNVADHQHDGETLKYPEYQYSSTTYVFDEDRFKIGDDGFYHVYDKTKYASTNGLGPILYANITSACRFLDKPFTQVEYGSNPMTGEVTVINNALRINGKNYKHFIEGRDKLLSINYYCESDCLCHVGVANKNDRICPTSCNLCNSGCRKCPEEMMNFQGYQAYANNDGMVAVTAELKEFLLGYCDKQLYFRDGQGELETKPVNGIYYQSVGESGWLFACAYYE